MGDEHETGRRGFLVEERRLISQARPPLVPIAITTRYKGIMGQPWPEEETIVAVLGGAEQFLSNGLASLRAYDAVRDYYTRVSASYSCDFLYCDILAAWDAPPPPSLPASFAFYGYDHGYYVGAYNSFSALYNDVLHGHYAPLQAFGVLLNAYRLLPSLEAVQRLDEARRQLIAGQAALETDEEFGPNCRVWVPGLTRGQNYLVPPVARRDVKRRWRRPAQLVKPFGLPISRPHADGLHSPAYSILP